MANVARVEATISAQNKLRPGLSSAARDLDRFRASQTKATRAFAATASQFRGLERMERVAGTLSRGAAALGGVYALQRASQVLKEATIRFAEVDRAMTRTGITGDAMADEVKKGTVELRNLSRDTATLFDPAQKGLDAITTSGRDFGDAMKMMPAILKTAQASGASVEDIANSSTALIDHMKISIAGLAEAQDTLAMGGKLGKFELKDMARYLPSMLPAFKALGQTGQDGLRKLVAMLQVIRSGTGTAEEAASSAQNIFSKMESEQTVKNFKEMGVDLPKAFAKARKEGKDLVDIFLELSNKALKGDLSKLPQLFQDMEVQRGMRPLLAEMQKRREYEEKLKGAKGTIDIDFKRVAEDAQAQLDRLKEGADRAKAAFGGLAGEIGSPLIKQGAENFDAVAQALERATQAAKEGGIGGAVKQLAGELTDKVVKDVGEGKRGMDDLQQRHDDDEKIAKWQDKGRGGMFDWLVGDTSRKATEDELGKLRVKERRQGLSPLDRVKKQKLEREIAGQEDAWSRDQMRKVDAEGQKESRFQLYRSGPLPQLTSASEEFADTIEGGRESRRASAFSRRDTPAPFAAPEVERGQAQRGRVQPTARPKAIGATAFPGFGADDADPIIVQADAAAEAVREARRGVSASRSVAPRPAKAAPQPAAPVPDRQPQTAQAIPTPSRDASPAPTPPAPVPARQPQTAQAIPTTSGDAPPAPPRFTNDTAKLPESPQGSAASNSLFSGQSLAAQQPDPRLTKMPSGDRSLSPAFMPADSFRFERPAADQPMRHEKPPEQLRPAPPPPAFAPAGAGGFKLDGIGEVQSKVDAAKASVESLGSSGASAGSALASGITSGLSTMEAQVAQSVARMQAQLNSLKAPSLSIGGGLGGFNTGKGMAEVR
ncbi:MAG: phage tail tape measure protein [Stutzerimonas stutzeri]|nr:MAG: phage tail tape measure protein [Stutzerimonas stutzeri]